MSTPSVTPKQEIPQVGFRELASLIESAGVDIRHNKADCPFHENGNNEATLSVYEENGKGKWKCHSTRCEKHGDAIDWLQQFDGRTRKDAIQEAVKRWGNPVQPKMIGGKPRTLDNLGKPDHVYRWEGPDGSREQLRWEAVQHNNGRVGKCITWGRDSTVQPGRMVCTAKPKGKNAMEGVAVWCEGAKAAQAVAEAGVGAIAVVNDKIAPDKDTLQWLMARLTARKWVLWPDAVDGYESMGKLAHLAKECGVTDILHVRTDKAEPKGTDAADYSKPEILARIKQARKWTPKPVKAAPKPTADPQGWETSKHGNKLGNSYINTKTFFKLEGVRVRYNTFTQDVQAFSGKDSKGKLYDQQHQSCWYADAVRKHEWRPTVAAWDHFILSMAHDEPYNPIKEYIDACAKSFPLDEDKARKTVMDWIQNCLGVRLSPDIVDFWMLCGAAAIRRATQEEGFFWKYIPVLIGDQDTRKSSALSGMVPEADWFSDNVDLSKGPKELHESVTGAWIVECQEMQGQRESTVERVKALVRSKADVFRKSYDRRASRYVRRFLLVATGNDPLFLRDATGNISFMPMETMGCSPDWYTRDNNRERLWAAFSAFNKAHAELWLTDSLRQLMVQRQARFTAESAIEAEMPDAIDSLKGALGASEGFKISALLKKMDIQSSNARYKEARLALERLGYVKNSHTRAWVKADPKADPF